MKVFEKSARVVGGSLIINVWMREANPPKGGDP